MFVEVMMHDYVLRTWRSNPRAPRRSYVCLYSWTTGPGSDMPPTVVEIKRRKDWMRRNVPRGYYRIFPEEDPDRGSGVG